MRGRAGVSLGLDGCEVRLCDPCARVRRVCVPASPGVFLDTDSEVHKGEETFYTP